MSRPPDARAPGTDTRASPPSATSPPLRKQLAIAVDTLQSHWPIAQVAVTRVLLAVVCALSVWHIGTYVTVACRRVFYPYTLEWMEGGVLEHVARVMEGKPLYVPPSIDFTPFIYTPFYYWVCALFARLIGLQLPCLRLVSFLASLTNFAVLYRIVVSRTRNPVAGLVTAGAFAACFEVCGGFLDLARVDSLGLCLLLLATWLLIDSQRQDVWVGLLLGLGFLTKQSTAIPAASLLALRVVSQRGFQRVQAAVVFGLIVVGSTWLQDRLSNGYYSYYVFRLPSEHAWTPSMQSGFWRFDIFMNIPFACVAALYALTTPGNLRSQLELWSVGVGFCTMSWVSRMHTGGATNVLMPCMAFFSWALGETLHRLSRPSGAMLLGKVRLQASTSIFGLLLCVFQLTWLIYLPGPHVPSASERKGSDELVKYLRGIKGPILAPCDPLLPRLVGQVGAAHDQALMDISYGSEPWQNLRAYSSVRDALQKRRYAAIVVNHDWSLSDLTRNYRLAPIMLNTGLTREGAPSRATQIWIRR
jgi:hypothetical protein